MRKNRRPEPFVPDPSVRYLGLISAPGYLVGDDGNMASCHTNKARFTDRWHTIHGCVRSYGYLHVGVYPEVGVRVLRDIHDLVLTAFVGSRPPGMVCRHLDGNRQNNHLFNICWGTPQQNADDRARHGTLVKGSKSPNAKLKESDVIEIRGLVKAGMKYLDIAKLYGVSKSLIYSIAHRLHWKDLQDDGTYAEVAIA
jgi:hypothetical protein